MLDVYMTNKLTYLSKIAYTAKRDLFWCASDGMGIISAKRVALHSA